MVVAGVLLARFLAPSQVSIFLNVFQACGRKDVCLPVLNNRFFFLEVSERFHSTANPQNRVV